VKKAKMARSFSLPGGAPRRIGAIADKDDPVWHAISGDSRFGELLRRMGVRQ